ncbi:hypothetical protein [Herpetosiphon geysericola]|uniref:Uncharacterized protein n=1 Tax=Herpetosiphon geysericola TaxID=70996 RepID=A0A0P6YDB3_9CHLR|nr:hypothetical protein [Herpetosiphon geysericola]KPL91441.1 hypothetical protein SE18_01945 [Herpetosiphon geysericola]
MSTRFLGIPAIVWSMLALIIAAIFVYVWPSDKVPGDTTSIRYLILRWGHTLVWVLIAGFILLRSVGASTIANLLGALAGITYLAFVAMIVMN